MARFATERTWWVALAVTVVLQMGVWKLYQGFPLALAGPTPGAPFPAVRIGTLAGNSDLALADLLSESSGCSLLVIVSSSCPICRHMRVTWPGRFKRWADSVKAPVRAIWLMEEGRGHLAEFRRGYTLDRLELAFIAKDRTTALRDLGIIGTPTLYLIDSQGRMQAGLVGDRLPSAALAQSVCS